MDKASFRTGISISPELHLRAMERARVVAGGKFARYVQQLIAADLENEPITAQHDQRIIERLATTYRGSLAPRLARLLVECDQPALLDTLLVTLAESLASGATPDAVAVAPHAHISADELPPSARLHHPPRRLSPVSGYAPHARGDYSVNEGP